MQIEIVLVVVLVVGYGCLHCDNFVVVVVVVLMGCFARMLSLILIS